MAKSIIAQNLKTIREVTGASRLKFSTFIGGVSPSIIQAYEDEKTPVPEHFMRRLSERVGLPIDTLTKKRLTKTDIPMLVVNASVDASEKETEGYKKLVQQKDEMLEQCKKQIEQYQRMVDLLTNQLQKG